MWCAATAEMTTARDRAGRSILRMPLHAALVHLPIALFPLSVLFDVASHTIAPGTGMTRAAFWCAAAGAVTGLVAGVAGIFDYVTIRDDHPAKKTATAHMILNFVALGLFAVGLGLRYSTRDAERTPPLPLWVSVVGLMVISYSGYLGGHLVYSDGIGVGRHRRHGLPLATTVTTPKNLPRDGEGMVVVGRESELAEGGTLHVEVNGVAMTLARCEGRLHAFQEFCPHRYGPLSEGVLRGCEIVCPWHNSRFDIRTGKVVHGPAKVDLKTFRVEATQGEIRVEAPPTSI
jgi:nitrite reductase/ring-hydroxylating ferredoxin subunit/uncharacterized membrane protein